MDWNAIRSSLRGPGALVSSVFDEDFVLRPDAIERNIREVTKRGLGMGGGFLIAPCADGEYATLSPEETGQVVAAARRGSNGTMPVVAGVINNDIRIAIRAGQAARDAGAVAVMMAPPIYYTLNGDAIFEWYSRFAAAVDIGIMIYEQSYRGPVVNAGIRPDLVGRLLEIPAVVSMKHIGLFNVADEFTILDRYHDQMAYIDSSGGYATTAGHMHGAAGWVTEIAPLWPEFEMRYWQLMEAGDYREAEMWRARIAPLFQFSLDQPSSTTAYSWVTIIKAALDHLGLEGGPVRPPFRALDAREREPVQRLLDELGFPKVTH